MKIFITGCARTGTTLLLRLFCAFKNTAVVGSELPLAEIFWSQPLHHPPTTFLQSGRILVAKRQWDTVFSHALTEDVILGQLADIAKEDIKIVNIIRDGWDVVHTPVQGSSIATAERWISSMEQIAKYGHIIKFQTRYEELTSEPDVVQGKLEKVLGLESHSKFSDYPAFVSPELFQVPSVVNYDRYGSRPIDTASVGHDVDYKQYMGDSNQQEHFDRLLKKWGYIE